MKIIDQDINKVRNELNREVRRALKDADKATDVHDINHYYGYAEGLVHVKLLLKKYILL